MNTYIEQNTSKDTAAAQHISELAFKEYHPVLYSVLRKYWKKSTDIEDIIQDTFRQFLPKASTVNPGSRKAYILAIAKNLSLAKANKKAKQREELEKYKHVISGLSKASGLQPFEIEQMIKDIRKVLSEYLKPLYVDILMRRVIYSETPKEISEDLDITPEKISRIIYSAKKTLREVGKDNLRFMFSKQKLLSINDGNLDFLHHRLIRFSFIDDSWSIFSEEREKEKGDQLGRYSIEDTNYKILLAVIQLFRAQDENVKQSPYLLGDGVKVLQSKIERSDRIEQGDSIGNRYALHKLPYRWYREYFSELHESAISRINIQTQLEEFCKHLRDYTSSISLGEWEKIKAQDENVKQSPYLLGDGVKVLQSKIERSDRIEQGDSMGNRYALHKLSTDCIGAIFWRHLEKKVKTF